jgi:hypothetical protein
MGFELQLLQLIIHICTLQYKVSFIGEQALVLLFQLLQLLLSSLLCSSLGLCICLCFCFCRSLRITSQL